MTSFRQKDLTLLKEQSHRVIKCKVVDDAMSLTSTKSILKEIKEIQKDIDLAELKTDNFRSKQRNLVDSFNKRNEASSCAVIAKNYGRTNSDYEIEYSHKNYGQYGKEYRPHRLSLDSISMFINEKAETVDSLKTLSQLVEANYEIKLS